MLRLQTPFAVLLVTGSWTVWAILPERPIREVRIDGPFGVTEAGISSTEAIARISTSNQPNRLRQTTTFGCYFKSDTGPVMSTYQLDLKTGAHVCLNQIDLSGPRKITGSFEMPNAHDFDNPPCERWWMEWHRNRENWTLQDWDTKALIASNRCDSETDVSPPFYRPDRRWLAIHESRPIDTGGGLPLFLRRWLPWLPKSVENHHLLVFDPKSGAMINDIPSCGVVRWAADADQFWTVDSVYDSKGNLNGVACRLWAVHKAGPPRWLILLTISCIGLTITPLPRSATFRGGSGP